jgi:hypothetical protein
VEAMPPKSAEPAKAPQLSQAECERLYAETLVELADLTEPAKAPQSECDHAICYEQSGVKVCAKCERSFPIAPTDTFISMAEALAPKPAAEVSRVEQIRAAYKDTYSFANGAASPSDTAYMLQQYDAACAELRRYEHRFGSTYAHQLEKEIAALKAEIVEYVEITNERNQLRRDLESAQEGERFYRREWESACERHNYAQEERDEARAEVGQLKSTINAMEGSFKHENSQRIKFETTLHTILEQSASMYLTANKRLEGIFKIVLDAIQESK